eukprot:sb/3465567/
MEPLQSRVTLKVVLPSPGTPLLIQLPLQVQLLTVDMSRNYGTSIDMFHVCQLSHRAFGPVRANASPSLRAANGQTAQQGNTNVGFTSYPDDDTVEVGDAVTLSCAVDTPSDSSSFNNVSSFQWYLSGTEITSGITTTDANPTTTSELVLSSVTVSDSGQYSCVVTYGDTTTTITSTEGVLTVDGVVTDPSASTGAQGSSITITAVFKGEPESVEWEVASLTTGASYTAVNTSLSTVTVTTSDTLVDGVNEQTTELVLTGLESTDEGLYRCTANYSSNTISVTTSGAVLTIYYIEMGNLLAVTGNSNNFTVSATIYASEEPDHVTWTANGTVIVDVSPTNTYTSTSSMTTSEFELSFADYSTSTFVCTAYFDDGINPESDAATPTILC